MQYNLLSVFPSWQFSIISVPKQILLTYTLTLRCIGNKPRATKDKI